MKHIKVLSLVSVIFMVTSVAAKQSEAKEPVIQPDGSIHIVDPDGQVIQIIRPTAPSTDTQEMFDRWGRRQIINERPIESASAADEQAAAR